MMKRKNSTTQPGSEEDDEGRSKILMQTSSRSIHGSVFSTESVEMLTNFSTMKERGYKQMNVTILPSIRLFQPTRKIRRNRDIAFSKYNKKSRPIPYPLIHCDEEVAFYGDLDDSDSTPDLKHLSINSGTLKTPSLFSCDSNYDKNQYTSHGFSSQVLRDKLTTPPRGFFLSPTEIECSPLSSSFHSESTSSLTTRNCDSPASDRGHKAYALGKTLCLTNDANEQINRVCDEIVEYDVVDCRHKNVLDYRSRKASAIWRKKLILFLYPTNQTMMRLTVFIFIYCVATFVLTTKEFLQFNVDFKVAEFKNFQNTNEGKSIKSRPLGLKYAEKRSFDPTNTKFLNGRVRLKRILGGIIFSESVEYQSEPLKLPKLHRSKGIGPLLRRMYSTKSSSYHHDGMTFPRIFSLFEPDDPMEKVHIVRELEIYPTVFSDNTQLYGMKDSSDPALSKMEPLIVDKANECANVAEWQSKTYPSCNGMHELDIGSLHNDVQLVGKKGYWRNAWKVNIALYDSYFNNETMILKTPRFDHNFEQAYYERDRVDAQAMEWLTFSPYVINIYGFCGRSVMTEFADGPHLGTLVDKAKKRPLQRLKIARDIALGLSHVHYGNTREKTAHFVHLDINPANVVVANNSLKINDFNIGIMVRVNQTSGLQCGFPAQFPNPQWRSPEEVNESQNLTEKVDVFSLGHIFFRLICNHEPWNKLEIGGKPSTFSLNQKVKRGILPHIPQHIMNTTVPEEKVILDAMLASYTADPDQRPSSKDISAFLSYQFHNLVKGESSEVKMPSTIKNLHFIHEKEMV